VTGGRRHFERVRQLPSGRWQARYPGPDGKDHTAPYTFDGKRSADQWLTLKESEIRHGDWLDPAAGSVLFSEFSSAWVQDRDLSPKTAQLYELLLRLHLNPTFGEMPIVSIREDPVRRWRAEHLKAGPRNEPLFGPVTGGRSSFPS
jgi:hypothetical protein